MEEDSHTFTYEPQGSGNSKEEGKEGMKEPEEVWGLLGSCFLCYQSISSWRDEKGTPIRQETTTALITLVRTLPELLQAANNCWGGDCSMVQLPAALETPKIQLSWFVTHAGMGFSMLWLPGTPMLLWVTLSLVCQAALSWTYFCCCPFLVSWEILSQKIRWSTIEERYLYVSLQHPHALI